jgi:copper(I)-binding protein
MIRPLALVLLAALAWGADITATKAWSRATAPTAPTGAVFVTLANAGVAEDRLVKAVCAVADTVELHTHTRDEQGVMRMRPVEAIVVPAGGSAELKPGADHIMLIGLKRPLVAGETLDLMLTFATAGDLPVKATVAELGATAAPANAGGCPHCAH